jgi:hypothetical protein
MTEAEHILETRAGEGLPAQPPDAPNSWDPSGRNVPAAKLDWTECLAFRQVRGIEVAWETDPPAGGSGPVPET